MDPTISQQPDLSYESAVKEFRKGHASLARMIATQVLAVNPNHLPALALLGECQIRLREFALAEEIFDAVLRQDPGDARAAYYLGLSRERLQRLDDAIAAYRMAVDIKPGFMEARTKLEHLTRDKPTREEGGRASPLTQGESAGSITDEAPPKPPRRRGAKGVKVVGRATRVRRRQEGKHWYSSLPINVITFVVEGQDQRGNPFKPVLVELRARKLRGTLEEGDEVEVRGWRWGRKPLSPWLIRNVSMDHRLSWTK